MEMHGWAGRVARGFAFALGLMLAMGAAACGEEGADSTGGGAPGLEWITGGEVALSALVGESATAALVFRNGGDKDLDFELSMESEWLTISPLKGSVAPGASQELIFSATCSEEAGIRTAGVAFLSNASQRVHALLTHLNCTKPPAGGLTVTVSGLPEGVAADIAVSGPDFAALVSETKMLPELVPAEYILTAEDITVGPATYVVAPAELSVVVEDGEVALAEFTYDLVLAELEVLITGLPEGVSADVTVKGPNDFEAHLTEPATLQGRSPGDYEVRARLVSDGVDRYVAAPVSLSLFSGDAEVARVQYEPVLSSLHVTINGLPDGVDADVTVTGVAGFGGHLTETGAFHNLVAGDYMVNVGTVTVGAAGYNAASLAVSLPSGGLATVIVNYRASASLAVTITGLPAGVDADVVVADGTGFSETLTATTTLTGLVPGSYTVTASSVTDAPGNVFTATGSATVMVSLDEVATLLVEHADPTVVTSEADSGPGSLRDVVASVNPGTRVHFAPHLASIILTSEEIALNKDLIIAGPGRAELEISGNQNRRIFDIEDAEVTIGGVTLIHGLSIDGGAIRANGTLHLEDCALLDNTASGRGGAIFHITGTLSITGCELSNNNAIDGGAIHATIVDVMGSSFDGNQATMGGGAIRVQEEAFVHTSTFANNTAREGGAVFAAYLRGQGETRMVIERSVFVGNQGTSSGGAIYSGGALSATNSTITLNSSGGDGGAINNFDNHDVYTNLTIVENTAVRGGGVATYGDAATSTTIGQSIIANNTAATSGPDVFSLRSVTPFVSRGYNIIGQDTDGLGWADGEYNDQVGSADAPLDPEVEALADNGGTTETMSLTDTSPARWVIPEDACLDAEDLPLLLDQRGFERPQDDVCSMGAFEPQLTP